MEYKGKYFKCISSNTFSWIEGEYYLCLREDYNGYGAFKDKNGNENGWEDNNDNHFDMKNPKVKKSMFTK